MQSRRNFLKRCAIGFNLVAVGALGAKTSRAVEAQNSKDKAALEAKDTASALTALGVQSPGPGKRILLDVPEIVDEKESVLIKVKSAIPNSDWIAVLIDKNPLPFVGQFDLVG